MKLVAQVVAALALVAYASPAFPCPTQKSQTTALNQAEQAPQPASQPPASAKAAEQDGKKLTKQERDRLASSQKERAARQQRAAAAD